MSQTKTTGLFQYLRLGLILMAVTAVVALLLAAVNAVTAGPIAQRQENARLEALSSVMARADSFSDVYSEDTTVERITGAYAGTELVGYCVQLSSNGFGGPIGMMVGVDTGGAVTGVVILDHAETPGLGSKAAEDGFLNQFYGKSGTGIVGRIDTITGATVTSKAVAQGVETALAAVVNYQMKGGGANADGYV